MNIQVEKRAMVMKDIIHLFVANVVPEKKVNAVLLKHTQFVVAE